MKKKKWAVDAHKTVAYLVEFIRKYIKCAPSDSLVRIYSKAMGMKVSDLRSPPACSKSYRVKISLSRKNSLFAQKTNRHRIPNFESPNSSKTACLYTLVKTLYETVAKKRQTVDIFGASTYIIVK